MINPNINLIDKNYIYSSSTIFNNVDFDKQIRPSIYTAQKYILNVIGSGIYAKIQSQVELSSTTQSNEFILSEFIRPCLLNYLLFESMPFLHYKLSPTGLQKMATENSIPLNITEMELIRSSHKNRAESIASQLRYFLIANSTLYPLYSNSGSSYDTIHPSKSTYFCGMYLGD